MVKTSIIRDNKQDGVILAYGTNISILSNQICNNSYTNPNLYNGISVLPGLTYFHIQDNTSRACGYDQAKGASNLQNFGILVNSGASDHYIITGNITPGNHTAGVSDGGTGVNKVVTNNIN